MLDFEEENEIIKDINKAIVYLKDHKLLVSKKIFYYEKMGKVLVLGDNMKYSLTYEEFANLYKDEEFVIYEDKDDTIDIERDNEYYSWTHK